MGKTSWFLAFVTILLLLSGLASAEEKHIRFKPLQFITPQRSLGAPGGLFADIINSDTSQPSSLDGLELPDRSVETLSGATWIAEGDAEANAHDFALFGMKIDIREDSARLGATIANLFSRFFTVEVLVDASPATDLDISDPLYPASDTNRLPVLMTGRWHLPAARSLPFAPYLGAGFGLSLDRPASGSPVQEALSAKEAAVEGGSEVGYHLNVGFDMPLNRDFAINVDLKYAWDEASLPNALLDYGGSEAGLNQMVASFGIRYRF